MARRRVDDEMTIIFLLTGNYLIVEFFSVMTRLLHFEGKYLLNYISVSLPVKRITSGFISLTLVRNKSTVR